MPVATPLSRRLGMRHPIVQAGMSWASSNADLPLAVTNAGGLGVVAAGPMRLVDLEQVMARMRAEARGPWAVNVPLYRPGVSDILDLLAKTPPPVIIASQGAPGDAFRRFRDLGCFWAHVTAFPRHAAKAAAEGVDALVVVGAEAGGHPPGNEVGTLVAVRRILRDVGCPVIAGGGVADGAGIAAMLALGAEAVQLGTRFLMTREAGVHMAYKTAVFRADVDGTRLVGRAGLPVRVIQNAFSDRVAEAEAAGMPRSDPDAWRALLNSTSLRQAALEGDVENGKVEAGQSAGLIDDAPDDLPGASDMMARLVAELDAAAARFSAMSEADQQAISA